MSASANTPTILTANYGIDLHSSDSESDSDYSLNGSDGAVESSDGETDPDLEPEDANGDILPLTPEQEAARQQAYLARFNQVVDSTEVTRSKLARKRAQMKENSGKRGRTKRGKSSKKRCKVTPEKRCSDTKFAGNHLIVENGDLRCGACNVTLDTESCAIKQHLKTAMHTRGLDAVRRENFNHESCRKILAMYPTQSGSTLPEATVLHRMDVTRAFLLEGVSFEPLRDPRSHLRTLLEHHRAQLPRADCMQYIPLLHEEEVAKLKHELSLATDISFSFDGTTEMYQNHMNAEQLACSVAKALTKRYGVPFEKWKYVTRDGAAVNGAAMSWSTVVYEKVTKVLAAHRNLSNSNLSNHERSPLLWVAVQREYPGLANPQRQIAFDATVAKMLPAFEKFERQINRGGRLNATWERFRGCRMLDYSWVRLQDLHALEGEVIFLVRLPCVPMEMVAQLKMELEEYRTAAIDHGLGRGLWAFWRQHQLKLPLWFAVARSVALIMTSSASCERIFSLYSGRFGDLQRAALEDYKEASIMLHYNDLQRRKNA
eukprot:gene22767-25791_t